MLPSDPTRLPLQARLYGLGVVLLLSGGATACREPASAVAALHSQAQQTRATLGSQLKAAREEIMRLSALPAEVRHGRGQEFLSQADTACVKGDLEVQALDRTLPAVAALRKAAVRKAEADLAAQTRSATEAAAACSGASRVAAQYLDREAAEANAANERAAAEAESARAYQDSQPQNSKQESN